MDEPVGLRLLREARAGDRAAFEALFGPLYEHGFRLALAMLHDREEAEDAVQEALFNAWRKLHTFREGSNVRPWFLTVVANQCRSVRRGRWYTVLRLPEVEPLARMAPDDGLPHGVDLRRALAALPHDQRLLLVLRYYLDLPYEEVARIVGGSPQAVKSRTHRALERLRKAFQVPEVAV